MRYDYIGPWKNKDGSWTGCVVEVPDNLRRVSGQESKEVKTISVVTKNTEVETEQEMKKMVEDLRNKGKQESRSRIIRENE